MKTGVEVEVIGLPGDPKKKHRTKWSTTPNAINPVWNEDPFVFEKVWAVKRGYTRVTQPLLVLITFVAFVMIVRSCFQRWPL